MSGAPPLGVNPFRRRLVPHAARVVADGRRELEETLNAGAFRGGQGLDFAVAFADNHITPTGTLDRFAASNVKMPYSDAWTTLARANGCTLEADGKAAFSLYVPHAYYASRHLIPFSLPRSLLADVCILVLAALACALLARTMRAYAS